MNRAFRRIGRWPSPVALVAMLATGCGSQSMPASVPATGGTDGGGGAGGSDGLSGGAAICGGPLVLWPQHDANLVYVCSFQADGPPRDPDQVVVYSDEDITDLVPANSSDGWRWGDASDTTILLTGSFCDEALAGSIPRLFALYTCPR